MQLGEKHEFVGRLWRWRGISSVITSSKEGSALGWVATLHTTRTGPSHAMHTWREVVYRDKSRARAARAAWWFTVTVNTETQFWVKMTQIYDGRFKSSWTRLITPSRNFVDVRWRSHFQSTSLGKRCTSYNAPPTSGKKCVADSWSLRNSLPRSSNSTVVKAQKSHRTRSDLNSVLGLEKVDRWNPIRTSTIQSRSRPMRFMGFSSHEKGALRRQEISKWSTVCSRFSRSGWSVVKSASLAKGGISKKETAHHHTSTKFRLGEIR
jgi:hypothetical protein